MPNNNPPPFVDNGNAPEFFANGIHDIEVMGPVCRLILYALRHNSKGHWVKEPPLHIVMPNAAVGPAILLAWEKMPSGVLVPSIGTMIRQLH